MDIESDSRVNQTSVYWVPETQETELESFNVEPLIQ